MRKLGKYLASLTKPELEELKELLNLTYDEEEVFNLISRGSSREQMAQKLSVSPSTVGDKITNINKKLIRLEQKPPA